MIEALIMDFRKVSFVSKAIEDPSLKIYSNYTVWIHTNDKNSIERKHIINLCRECGAGIFDVWTWLITINKPQCLK